ncbi:MAG: hypothetical protein Q7U20_10795 [Caulobacter sp.]|nr:hypothetical protein [Caulobacter sp.]
MKVTIEPPPAEGEPLAPLHRRIGWFIGLALASALATAVVAYALKALLV